MAGKTLPGIGEGEDESGEREASEPGLVPRDGATSRPTDRVGLYSGPAVIDDDKVAEGLKRLRSLDEPLGSFAGATPALGVPTGPSGTPTGPSGTPTMKDGSAVSMTPTHLPIVGTESPEQTRARGTAHGHALSGPAGGQSMVPMPLDDRMKGTLMGHSVHLPDLLAAEENRQAEVRAIERASATSLAVLPTAPTLAGQPSTTELAITEPATTEFSNRDSRFFDSAPVNNEFEPEHPRATVVTRAAIFLAVLSVFVVAAIAWVRVRRSDPGEAPAETVQVPATPPPARDVPPPPTSTIPSSGSLLGTEPRAALPGEAIPPPPSSAPVAPPPVPHPAPTALEPAKPDLPPGQLAVPKAAAEGTGGDRKAPEKAAAKPRERSRPDSDEVRVGLDGAIERSPGPARRPGKTPIPGARPAHTPAALPPVSPTPGKHAKVADDPDGTLPLTD